MRFPALISGNYWREKFFVGAVWKYGQNWEWGLGYILKCNTDLYKPYPNLWRTSISWIFYNVLQCMVGEHYILLYKIEWVGAPGWLSWLNVPLRLQSWSQFVGLSPVSGSVLTAQSLEPVSDSVSLSLCPSPTHTPLCLSFSLSKINIFLKRSIY